MKKQVLLASTLLGTAVVLGASLFYAKRAGNEDIDASFASVHADSVVEASQPSNTAYRVDTSPSWKTNNFIQAYAVENWRYITVIESTLDANGEWQSQSYAFSSSFDIHATASRGKNKFYWAGVADNGDVTIQRWKMRVIGMPGGGSARTMIKTELYRGTAVPPPTAMGVDPEARFVLFLAGTGADTKLYSIQHSRGGAPTVVYSAGPGLPLDLVDAINRYDHVSLGRIWVLMSMPELAGGYLVDHTAIVLNDTNNDGVFDVTYVDQVESLYDQGILGLAGWAGDVDSNW